MTELGGVDASVFRFRWIKDCRIPAALDLRQRGWLLESAPGEEPDVVGLFDATGMDGMDWMQELLSCPPESRRQILVTGVASARDRAAMLQIGCGDALPPGIDMEELAARAARVAGFGQWLPRTRRIGTLELDLLAREGYVGNAQLNLNPREFALIWRLADSPNQPVCKQALIHDVWHMGFVPETNSIAVHMSRLRRKLAFLGLEGIIRTVSEGYCLCDPGMRMIAPRSVQATTSNAPSQRTTRKAANDQVGLRQAAL